MPPTFLPYDHIRISLNRNRVWVSGLIKDNLDVIMIRKHQLACRVRNAEAELLIPFDHAPLGLAIDAGISLQSAYLDAGSNDLLRNTPTTKLGPHGQPLKLGEICEVANAQSGNGLVADIAEQMRSREIVSVEFLAIGAPLFTDKYRTANSHHAHEVFN